MSISNLYGGVVGVGAYSRTLTPKIYKVWDRMHKRCFDFIDYPTYKETFICNEWKNLQVFGAWYDNIENGFKENYHLDKDILFKGNKIYSPETCCFVPSHINKLFLKANSVRGNLPIGVVSKGKKFQSRVNLDGYVTHLGTFNTPEEAFLSYKQAKEKYIKEIAEKDKPNILPKVYNAMVNYKVDITD